jgi:hypothetical protein
MTVDAPPRPRRATGRGPGRAKRCAGLAALLGLIAGLSVPGAQAATSELQAACLAEPSAACVFATAEELARRQTPPERHIVAVAVAWAETGDFQHAAAVIATLQPFSPSHEDALRRLSAVAARQGREQVLASLLAEIQNERTAEQARADAAVAYARAGHVEQARALLSGLSFPADRASVLAEIGLAEEKAGRPEQAETAFAAARASIEQGEVAMSTLGIALARAGHIDQALEVGKGLVAGTPLYALQVAVVSGLLDADRVSRALAVIEEIPNAGIREAARLKILAFLLEARRDTQADELAASFDDGMGDPKVKIAYSRALARRGDFGAAIAMIEGLDPSTRSPVHYAIARQQIAQQDLSGAKASLEQVTNGRQRQDLLRLIALAEASSGSPHQALATALSIEPDRPRLAALLDLAKSLAQDP